MKATPQQIADLVRHKGYEAIMVLPGGKFESLSKRAVMKLDVQCEYTAEVAPNGVELLIRRVAKKTL